MTSLHSSAVFLTVLQTLLRHSAQGYFVEMITEAQVHFLQEGDSLALECNFHADNYNLFDYPVLWRKVQRGEETTINMMGNINEPFASSNRFEADFISQAPRFKFKLTIIDVIPLDSGNYSCEIRGPYATILGTSIHRVYVRAAVQSLTLHLMDGTEVTDRDQGRSVHLLENRQTKIRCVAHGGSPPPTIDVISGRRDVTSEFNFRKGATLSGRRGMRLIVYRTERCTHSYKPKAQDSELQLQCMATVPGLRPLVTSVRLDIDYSPKVSCNATMASLEDKAVHLRCELRARPRYSSLHWIVDGNGTQLQDGQISANYRMKVIEREGGVIEAFLFFNRLRPQSFRRYVLVVQNAVAETAAGVDLLYKPRVPYHVPLADSSIGYTNNRTTSRDTSRIIQDKMAAVDVRNSGASLTGLWRNRIPLLWTIFSVMECGFFHLVLGVIFRLLPSPS